jgi:hypothetical protein
MTLGESQGFMKGVTSSEPEARRVLDRALDARRPEDLIERHVDAGSRSLVAAVEQPGAHRLDLGQVSKDLVAAARGGLAVDRALVEIADERARAAREDVFQRIAP